MSNKQFFNNLSATYADVRKLDVKKINLKGKNILEYIEESVPTITHSKDTRETVTENDLWGQWVETLEDGTIVIHDDYLSNPNSEGAWNSEVKAVQDNKAYTSSDASGEPLCNIQTEMIKDGSYMFQDTSLELFYGNLSNLINGSFMFSSTPITSFSSDSDFNSYSDGPFMNLSSLVNGEYMFYNTSLESFIVDLSSLVNGSSMFDQASLKLFAGNLSSLSQGQTMFRNTPLEFFYGNLSSLVDGSQMFYNTSLESFIVDLSSLVNGSSMFDQASLASFNGDLSSLVSGYRMFSETPLESFSGNLSSLEDGHEMFCNTSIKSFSGDLSSLVSGYRMFISTPLKSFSGDLSSLVNGWNMFWGTTFESFNGDLSNLVDGSGMFTKCKLSSQSVMCIVESIRNITEEKAKYPNSETGETGEIPWVTYDSTTQKYSALFGFMEDGTYVYTYDSFTNTISSSHVGQLTLGINVTNDSETIEQQLQTFAEGCLCDSWAELKQEFVDKGWTVTFLYGGEYYTQITLSEDEQFRGVPVYARLIEVSDEEKDRAEYCTEDGTKFYDIDWGHDVTDYDAYQYFGSLLEACGYYGVIPKKYLEEQA